MTIHKADTKKKMFQKITNILAIMTFDNKANIQYCYFK